MDNFLRGNERLEDLGLKGLRIIQNPDCFCFGIDAVLLAWFASGALKRKSRAVDLGTGTGIIPLLLCGRTEVGQVDGVEIQENMAEMARRSVALNGLEGRIRIVTTDLKKPEATIKNTSYDVVVSNPPYMKITHGLASCRETKAVSRHEILCSIDDIAVFAKQMLKDRGKLFIVHRADRLSDIMEALRRNRIEPKRLLFVHPYMDKPANLVLVEGVKSGRPFLIVEPPLAVYNRDGSYTDKINAIYGTDGPTQREVCGD